MTPDDPRDDHLRADFAPHERATIREMLQSFLRSRWIRSVIVKFLGYTTAVLVLMGLFRDRINDALVLIGWGQ